MVLAGLLPSAVDKTNLSSVYFNNPNITQVSTSFVERQNLTMRMSMRRMTRLTNAFSKKIENQAHAVALHFMHYTSPRFHQTLRVTPRHGSWNCRSCLELGRTGEYD